MADKINTKGIVFQLKSDGILLSIIESNITCVRLTIDTAIIQESEKAIIGRVASYHVSIPGALREGHFLDVM